MSPQELDQKILQVDVDSPWKHPAFMLNGKHVYFRELVNTLYPEHTKEKIDFVMQHIGEKK